MTPTIVISLLCGYFLVLILISWFTSRKADNDAFFLGERKSPWYIVAFGMIGASLSGITFISIPGWVGDTAKQFSYMQMVFGYLVGYFIVAYVLMPIYYKLNLTSIYSYLKTRFGKWSYKTGSALFLISRVIGASIRLLLVASVLQLILFKGLGIPFELTVLASVLLIWVYTNRGGIKTIIWTDTLQTAFMLASVIATVYFIGDALNINEKGGIIEGVKNSDYSRVFYFDNWLDGNYFWKHFLGGIFITIGMTGLDQDMMQKNLSCKNLKDAQLNMISFAGVLVVVNLVFLALGALLYMYFDQTGVGYNALKVIKRTDLLFAEIAQSGKLGITVSILFLLGLIAAAYSSADSALTSLTTSFSVDFLKLEEKEENRQKKIRQRVHIGMSIILVITIIVLRRTTDDAAIWTLITLAGFTYGPLIGLFFFGILTKRNLKDYCVPWVCGFVPVLIGIVWYLNKNGLISWFGKYQIGAELIIYNAIVSFICLWFISYRPKS